MHSAKPVIISYDSSNPLNPTKYGSKGFNFEGRRLTRFSLTDEDYDYKYNDQGLRIQKKNNHMTTWDYTYDGDKLIYESSPYGKLNFLYDENNMLYGFIKDNTEKYLYIRDNLQNIIAITSLSGEIVVKYAYDAWGKLLSTTGSLASTIGALNPFKYKGYYYDQESGMYYCKSRYYVPDWCRWLNADCPSELKIENVTELNLFAYCNNNPIIGYDPNGLFNWWKLAAIALTVVAVATAVVVSVVTCGAGSVAATIAITSAITFTAKATEVGILQYKKSKADGDTSEEVFSDVVDVIFGNGLKIIGFTPLTKLGGFASGFYSQSKLFFDSLQLLKSDGFNLKNILGIATYSIGDRFKHFGDYASMSTSTIGYITGYGFAFYNVGWAIGAAVSDDYEKIAKYRKYKLY